jgi:phospholipid transport system substrate-binding protein
LAAEPPPDQVIQQITDRMIALILQEKSRFDREPQHFYQAIDQLMTPASDFDRIAKGVMGKYYRQASDAQRKRFAGVFKERMLQTYAKAFMKLRQPEDRGAAPIGRSRATSRVRPAS